ncbi:hypothetical protein HMPREF0766_12772 [Sphingobacterium spiritivorum ATCC 33861]|uniref:Uncharacterized protein n=1 Tax=Sphingobacterium spiritivorum ATCC 33861 TaxID=525373 RepID=D7VP52_SPHSI|nr:hypothetical protein HMPREF0766_12772 [Sphingobacterium spiritivorum ATCC 33861]
MQKDCDRPVSLSLTTGNVYLFCFLLLRTYRHKKILSVERQDFYI